MVVDLGVELIVSWVLTLLTIVGSSTGLWALINKRLDRRDSVDKLIMGIAHDRIVETGQKYIDRGAVTKDEYGDFLKYLVEPYESLGGNGVARRMRQEVDKLPLTTNKH